MDKLGEFVDGLQALLDRPHPPQDDVLRVIQSTQREFLASALAAATVAWPTRTHLELVKMAIGMPIPEPARAAVMADPTTSHEAAPFFAADYFDRVQQQLLSMSPQQLADSDGSWVRNVGFSIEATLMQAARRMDELERLEESAQGAPELGYMRQYCAHVLGAGTLAARDWEAVARTASVVFYILPSTARPLVGGPALPSEDLPDMGDGQGDPPAGGTAALYSSWLAIVSQMIENHGPALCRRLPTVIEDPATRQFRWGIPTLHAVAATEVLRNIVLRRTLLAGCPQPAAAADDEQRLEQLEQSVLASIISKDASAVYGMMSELHRPLQMLHSCTRGPPQPAPAPGTPDCVALSLQRACHGLAPILGFDEQALMQAMDMAKLRECLADMKSTVLRLFHAPLYGRYPHAAGARPAYAESLLLRTATTLFNADQPWGDAMAALAPAAIPAISQATVAQLTRALRITAAAFDALSLCTVSPASGAVAPGHAWQRTATARLLEQPFMCPPGAETAALAVEWVSDFVRFGCERLAPPLLRAHCAAMLDHVLALDVDSAGIGRVVGLLESMAPAAWRLLAATRFVPPSGTGAGPPATAMSVLWSCAQRLRGPEAHGDGEPDAGRWQLALALSCPDGPFLAYAVMALCAAPARQLVQADPRGAYSVQLNRQGTDVLHTLERALGADGLQAWPDEALLFVPPLYAGRDGSDQAALWAQAQLPHAIQLLSGSSLEDWAQLLGLAAPAALPFSESDMRMVACLVRDYARGAKDMFALLPRLLEEPEEPGTAGAENPFAVPHILTRLPPIETATNSNACDIDSAVRQWRRCVASLPFAESRKHIQALVSSCYLSNSKHYLEAVIVRFMEAEPAVGVELVVGSIADHMWKSQIVYARRASPFYAIRDMFAAVSPPRHGASAAADAGAPTDNRRVDDLAARLARSHKEPVFNAVVGGKVRPRSQAVDGSGSGQVLTTAEQESAVAAAVATPHAAAPHRASGGETEPTVRCPAACLRILLLLTDLCYGNSLRETPIHMWLTDCLSSAPASLQSEYFERAIGQPAPNFSHSLPLEPDWHKKVKGTVSLWANDRRMETRPLVRAACAGVMRHVLSDGARSWKDRWEEWRPILHDTLYVYFTRPNPSPAQIEIVRSMVAVPLAPATEAGRRTDLAAAFKDHPLQLLTDMLVPAKEHGRLAFADSRDWFLVHVVPQLLATMADSDAARDILGAVLSAPVVLYQNVAWFDIATTLVQNVPLGNGCPVTMSAKKAKKNFISYLSPLARMLLAIAAHIDGDASTTRPGSAVADDTSATKMDIDNPDQADRLPDAASEDAHDDSDFDWPWLDERLVMYVNASRDGTSDLLADTLSALIDVYTYSSTRGLRRSIENVLSTCCLSDPILVQPVLERLFGQRPLDVFTLHTLRPRTLSSLAPLPSPSGDSDAQFRPGAEVYPLARRVLLLGLGDGDAQATDAVARVIVDCMWAIGEEPDVRRSLIALKPRLIPKEQRPSAADTSVSEDTVLQTTSGSLHIPAEATASAGAYALDRSVCLLGLLAARADNDPHIQRVAVALAHSPALLAVLMVAVGDSMRQFATLTTTRELLNALWALADAGAAEIDGVSVSQVWMGVNLYTLAQRLNSQLPEEYTTWAQVQAMPAK